MPEKKEGAFMKLSTEFAYGSQLFGSEAAIEMLAEIGFDALDFSMYDPNRADNPVNHDDYKERMTSYRNIAEKSGISFNQTHAPFPCFKGGDGEYNERVYPQLIRAIEATAILGAPHVVMHPGITGKGDELERNIELFNSLAPYCESFGVKIAIENLIGAEIFCGNPEDQVKLLDNLDRRYFTGLIDVGHAEISGGGAVKYIKALGAERLGGLHVHDNDRSRDLHNLPFTKSIDFGEVTAALAEVGYAGDFTFEAGFFIRQFPKEIAREAYIMMHAVGRRLISMIEEAS